MATYYGFNTIDQEKKFSLTDFGLVKRDLLNSLLIKPGEKLGNPQYGSKINTILFETQDAESFLAIDSNKDIWHVVVDFNQLSDCGILGYELHMYQLNSNLFLGLEYHSLVDWIRFSVILQATY
jgi:hypothetical protein